MIACHRTTGHVGGNCASLRLAVHIAATANPQRCSAPRLRHRVNTHHASGQPEESRRSRSGLRLLGGQHVLDDFNNALLFAAG